MASNGRRKLLLNGVVTQIATATGASYFYDYSTDVVSLEQETLEERIQKTSDVAIRVRDGASSEKRQANLGATAVLDIEVEITVKAKPPDLVVALQNVLADLSLVLGKNPSLGGSCTSCIIAAIEKPQYDFPQTYAVTVMHLRAEYDYQPGVDT